MQQRIAEEKDQFAGILYAAGAYVIWGLIPLYWRLLPHVPPFELTVHRVFWCAAVVALVLYGRNRFAGIRKVMKDGKTIRTLIVTSLLISMNWGIYIWSIATHQLVEASFGYYINPLVSIALGIALLGERLTRARLAAILLAAVAVALQALSLDHFPWLALTLAFSFAAYGYFRKTAAVESLDGLFIETAVLLPLTSGLIAVWAVRGEGHFASVDMATDLLLIVAGPMTAIPLALFSAGARRIRLSTLGFLQYLSPTISLVIAVALFGEPFTAFHAATFGLIWFALALISLETLRRNRI
ncbi:MAG: EamA family transporter RarD [Alphaproteobacteria bacterium]|nr:EamA family transporter RarD [Alphaproteobacteria bacterium]